MTRKTVACVAPVEAQANVTDPPGLTEVGVGVKYWMFRLLGADDTCVGALLTGVDDRNFC